MLKRISFLLIAVLGFLLFPSVSWSVMSSSNYTIFADSIDSGGVLSASGTYSLQGTAGDSPAGSSTSSTYEVIGGYQAMDWSQLAINISTTSVGLGTLNSISEVAIGNTTLAVTADASSGYILSVASVSGSSLAAVSDGAVSPGQEEYGVAVSGGDRAFSDDRAITAGLVLASSSTPVTAAQIVLTFKVGMALSTSAGARSQSVTVMVSTSI